MAYGTWDKVAAEKAGVKAGEELLALKNASGPTSRDMKATELIDWWGQWYMACGHKALWKILCSKFGIDTRHIEGQHKQEDFADA